MSEPPRGLSAEEKAAWARLSATVTPIHPAKAINPVPAAGGAKRQAVPGVRRSAPAPVRQRARELAPADTKTVAQPGLDSHWERRLRAAKLEPDFTLDLHGCSLDAAHQRLEHGMAQARAMGARLVLLITGKPRPVDPADRSSRRGAIRAKVLDWLAAGPHGDSIAAVRKAHRRHGGEGALYLVLRRRA